MALVAGLFQACDLERYPLTDLSEETFWNSESNAELALTSLYRGSLTDGVEYNPFGLVVLSRNDYDGTSFG